MKFNKDKYLKFPLCLLASNKVFNQVLNNIFCFSIVHFSQNLTNQDLAYAKECEFSEYAPSDFDNSLDEQLFIVSALEYFKIKIVSIVNLENTYSDLEKYVNDYQAKHGKDAYAKVHIDVFVETLNDDFAGKYSERYFRTLCSITSILGTNKKYPFKRITKERIICGYYGFKSKAIFNVEFKGSQLITIRQLGTAINKLAEKNLFQKATRKRRLTYYSTLLSHAEFIEAISQFEFKQLEKKSKQTIADNYISKRLNEEVSKHPYL